MKIRLSYDESMYYWCIGDGQEGGVLVEVPDEQAARWQQACDNWAKAQAEMNEAMQRRTGA
jgi:hypothetical protein